MGNHYSVDIPFGTLYFFGSIAVWASLAVCGPRWALTAAFVGAISTIPALGQWSTAALFVIESLCLVKLYQISKTLPGRITASVLIFWMFLGFPLAFVLYNHICGFSWETTLLISTQHAFNSVLNAMVAALLVNLTLFVRPSFPISERSKQNLSYSSFLQACLGLLLIVPIAVLGLAIQQKAFNETIEDLPEATLTYLQDFERKLSGEIFKETDEIGRDLLRTWVVPPDEYSQWNSGGLRAPVSIFRLDKDDQWHEILSNGNFRSDQVEAVLGSVFYPPLTNSSRYIGCLDNHLMSLYTDQTSQRALSFFWPLPVVPWAVSGFPNHDSVVKCETDFSRLPQAIVNESSIKFNSQEAKPISGLSSWRTSTVTAVAELSSELPSTLTLSAPLEHALADSQSDWILFLSLLVYMIVIVLFGGQLLYYLFRRWIERFILTAESFLSGQPAPTLPLNMNFFEDRQISTWLKRFSEAVQSAERGKVLAQSNFRTLIARASSPIFALRHNDEIVEWNPALTQLTGFDQSKIVGKSLSQLAEGNLYFSGNFPTGNASDLMFDLRGTNGKLVNLMATELPIDLDESGDEANPSENRAQSGDIVYYIAKNLSEIRNAQANLIQASRLAALGEMASSFAHELNQPLNIIAFAAGNYLERANVGDVPTDYTVFKMKRIEQQALRAGEIIQGIRKFVLEIGEEGTISFDPVARSRSALELLSEQIRLDGIKVRIEEPPTPVRINGRPILFEQTMVNLVTNARQAMRLQTDRPRVLSLKFQLKADCVIITVEDTGPGIPIDLAERVFDAFFSTKSKESGTGIGLYICRTVIEAMNGKISVLESDVGACIEMRFPNMNRLDQNDG